MNTLISWIKNNKLMTVLIIVILFLVATRNNGNSISYQPSPIMYDSAAPVGSSALTKQRAPLQESVANSGMVIQESYLSLVVTNVNEVQKAIIDKAVSFGGFMVTASLQNPQEAPTSTITVRIPASKLNQALEEYRKLSVKVVSENLQGEDVTDQYVDIEERMKTLTTTKAKFEDILTKATQVQDILTVQRELVNLQVEIDNLKGQQEFLKKSADMAKITVYLSTDELALPYQPDDSWRPQVIFKEAVRSLIETFRAVGGLFIWLAVYSVILIPLGIIFYIWKKKTQRKDNRSSAKGN